MKSAFGKLSRPEEKTGNPAAGAKGGVAKPGQLTTTSNQQSQLGAKSSAPNQLQLHKKPGQIDPVAKGPTQEEIEKKKAEDAKQQKKEETSEERFTKVSICEEESRNLDRVFELFVHQQKTLAREGKGKKEIGAKGDKSSGQINIDEINWFDSKAVRAILNDLGVKEFREHDIDIMIWEVDENLDWRVDKKEFSLMYKKCIEDQMGLEPRNLFNLVQFLMFCKPPEDDKGNPVEDKHEFRKRIKAEDTYFLIYGRLDRQETARRKKAGEKDPVPGNGEILKLLDEEIKLIFLDCDPKNSVGMQVDPEMEVDYMTYLKRVNKQALNKRQEGKDKKKAQKEPKDK